MTPQAQDLINRHNIHSETFDYKKVKQTLYELFEEHSGTGLTTMEMAGIVTDLLHKMTKYSNEILFEEAVELVRSEIKKAS